MRAACRRPVSVAEVAATLSIPLGVARVLLSDMAELGLLHIHGTERTAEGGRRWRSCVACWMGCNGSKISG